MIGSSDAPCIYPTFRYRDAESMIGWLQDAFGFALRAKYMDDGKVMHAELMLGASIIMLGEARDDGYGAMVGTPGTGGGKSVYVAVADADAAFARAKNAGVEILEGLTNRDYGSREFICRDPQGNVWCFGTYWPKATDKPA